MNKNTSISLGNYFDQFVFEAKEESKVFTLKKPIQEGIDSGITHDFDQKNILNH